MQVVRYLRLRQQMGVWSTPPGYQQAPDNAPFTQGGGIGGGDNTGEGIGAQAWNMLSRAGEALKGAEEAAWKAVNGNK